MAIQRGPGIAISSYYHLHEVIEQADAVVSILGSSDKLMFPDVGQRPVLRLEFDDVTQARKGFTAPADHHIDELIAFSRAWAGAGTLLIHCRAGSGRSPAAGMIVAAAIGIPKLSARIRVAKSYFTPNQTMLEMADARLGLVPGLAGLGPSGPQAKRREEWGPVRILLEAPKQPAVRAQE